MIRPTINSVRQVAPFRIYAKALCLIFFSEFAVMVILPRAFSIEQADWRLGLTDALLLTLILIPGLWLVVIRPLRALADSRSRMLKQFITVQEAERRRISRDLHDEIGQSLTSLLLGLRVLEGTSDPTIARQRAGDMRDSVTKALHGVRRLARGLRPAALDQLGLKHAILRQAEEFGLLQDIAVHTDVADLTKHQLSQPLETAIYRIIQEGLTNIARHADARNVRVAVGIRSNEIELEIEDDGRGFDAIKPPENREAKNLGLKGIAERVELLDGKFRVQSRRGCGTYLLASIPLEGAAL